MFVILFFFSLFRYPENYREMYLMYLSQSILSWLIKPYKWREYISKIKLYLSLLKLTRIPRYTLCYSNILGKKLEIADKMSFFWTYEEIFEKEIYKFETKYKQPFIIDGGANIGLGTLYFKQLFPESKIIAFEPDRQIFKILKNNIENFNYSDINLINKALWNTETTLEFSSDGADSGRLSGLEEVKEKYLVEAVSLRSYLQEPVAFLKIDIEGSELKVLEDCADLLVNVENLFVEYHSFANCPQELDKLLGILNNAGYRIHIHSSSKSPQPFIKRNLFLNIDMLLNIFAFRE